MLKGLVCQNCHTFQHKLYIFGLNIQCASDHEVFMMSIKSCSVLQSVWVRFRRPEAKRAVQFRAPT